MGAYLERLTADMKEAMKARDKARLGVVRMLIADLQRKALEGEEDTLSDDEEVAVLHKAVKTRSDTVDQAKAAGRTEIVEREQAEIDIIQTYLPKQMTTEEVVAKVGDLAAEIDYQGGKDRGRFMKEWMSRYKGLADGKSVQAALNGLA